MKKFMTLILILGISGFAFGQNNTINYKALIKDNLGNVVANQTVSVQFTILANGSPVYVETQTPTTDVNGIMIVDIGNGTTVDVFTDIDWSANTTLKTEIDITGGTTYIDMGTTEFKSVPYALNAGNTAFSTTNNVTSNAPGDIDTDNFVFGSTQLDHNTSFGIFDYDTRMFFNKSRGAFRAGATNSQGTASNNGTVWNDGSLGLYSFATGLNTLATNEYTTALGYFTQASGRFSTAIGNQAKALNLSTLAMGYSTTASGEHSTAIGDETTASGNSSTSFGYRTRAEAYNSTVFGRYNIGTGNPTTWIETDPLFEIGNGPNDITFTNALTVLKNGTITAPSFDLNEITDEKALVTKEYADALVSGLEAIDESNGIGWRLKGRDPANFGNIGLNAVDISVSTSVSTTKGATGQASFAAGSATASGYHSFAMGISNTEASNDMSFAFGQNAKATGNNSHAFGYNVTASGDRSFISGFDGSVSGTDAVAFGENANAGGDEAAVLGGAFNTTSNNNATTIGGENNTASGQFSAAAGFISKAQAFNVFSIGSNNIGGGDPDNWIATDPLFEVGNGYNSAPSNALTVLKNGNTIINGQAIVNEGTANNTTHALSGIKIHTGNFDSYGVYGQNTVTDYYGVGVRGDGGWKGVEGAVYGTGSNFYYGVTGNSTGANTGTNYGVYGLAQNGATNYAVYADGDLNYTGTLTNVSDRKFKSNIHEIDGGIASILRLKPSSYLIKESYQKSMHMSSKPQFGFIAQELQEVFPDLVSQNVHPGKTKEAAPIEYLGVNYIGLIPILTKGIQEQQQQIEDLKAKVASQDAIIQNLLNRMTAIEQAKN